MIGQPVSQSASQTTNTIGCKHSVKRATANTKKFDLIDKPLRMCVLFMYVVVVVASERTNERTNERTINDV